MSTQFTITITGQDHPQLINQLAAITHEHGGQWLASKISRLDQHVAGIIKIQAPTIKTLQLKRELEDFTQLNINFMDDEDSYVPDNRKHIVVDVESRDRRGLIQDISQVLNDVGADIEHIENARMPITAIGEVMFTAKLNMHVAEDIDLEQLATSIRLIQDGLHVQIEEKPTG